MRKLILGLMFGVMLLGLVSASINVINVPKPVLTATLQAGGTLNEQTYYFDAFFDDGSWAKQNGAKSPASDEINITTNSTHKTIVLSWKYWNGTDYVSGTPGSSYCASYINIRWDNYTMINPTTNETYSWCNLNNPVESASCSSSYGHRKWLDTFQSGGRTGTSYTLSDMSQMHDETGSWYYSSTGRNHPQMAISPLYKLGGAFNHSKGVLCIEDDGTAGDYDDLVNELEATNNTDMAEWTYDSMMILGFLDNKISGGSLDFTKKNIIFVAGEPYSADADFSEGAIVSSPLTAYVWGMFYGDYTKNTLIYKTYYFNPIYANLISDNNLLGSGTVRVTSALDFSLNYLIDQLNWAHPETNPTTSNFSGSVFYKHFVFAGIDYSPSTKVYTMDNIIMKTYKYFSIYWYYWDYHTNQANATLNLYNSYYENANGNKEPIKVYNYYTNEVVNGGNWTLNNYYDEDFYVNNRQDNPQSNTKIRLTDVVGNIYEGTTDANGEASIQIQTNKQYSNLTHNGYSDFTTYNPFKIELIKDGQTYYAGKINYTSKETTKLTLQPNEFKQVIISNDAKDDLIIQ